MLQNHKTVVAVGGQCDFSTAVGWARQRRVSLQAWTRIGGVGGSWVPCSPLGQEIPEIEMLSCLQEQAFPVLLQHHEVRQPLGTAGVPVPDQAGNTALRSFSCSQTPLVAASLGAPTPALFSFGRFYIRALQCLTCYL